MISFMYFSIVVYMFVCCVFRDMISKYMAQMKELEQKRMPLQKLKDLMSGSGSGTR